MSLDKMFPNISSRLRKRQNDKFMEANPNLFLPIKQLSRRVQLQKNFDNFNHSCNYLKNVIRIGTRSQIPSVIIALMEHVSNLLKLCATWSNLLKDPENQIEQYRRDVLINLTELVRTLDFFEEIGEDTSQATHVLYKVFMSIEKLKNTLFESLPQEEEADVDSYTSPAGTPLSPPHSPKLSTPKKPLISKSKSIPSSGANQITELEHSPIIRRRLNTPTHTKSMVLTQTKNHLSQPKLSNSYSSINIRNSHSNPNITNGNAGHVHKSSLPEPQQRQKLTYHNNIMPEHRSEYFPPSSHLSHLSLGSELDYNDAPTTMQQMNGPNQLQYMKRFQAMMYDPFENRTLTFTYDTDLDAPPLPVKNTRNIIPQLVYHQEAVRRIVWEDNCIGKVRDRANTSDYVIEQKDSVDNSLDLNVNLSPKGSVTPSLQRAITSPSIESQPDGFLAVPSSRLTMSSGTSSPSPSPVPSPIPSPIPNDSVDEAILLNRALSITQEEYEEARQQVAAQLRYSSTESGVPAIPPKRKQVISYLALLRQTLSYEFPADQYEPLYVPHTSPAVLPPPKPAKKRNSRNLEKSNGSESDLIQAYPTINHKSYSSLGSEHEYKQLLTESTDENPLFMTDVTHILQFLIEDGGQSLRGGPPDALIAYATTVSSTKIGNIFCEAFIHTYSTFINFEELLDKLKQRYFHMKQKGNNINCKNIIILLTRILRELRIGISEEHKLLIQQIIYSLIIEELILGISLKKELESYYSRIKQETMFGCEIPTSPKDFSLPMEHITNFKASILAEQMTLMDNELFKRVTNQELLAWASDQTEGHHLSKFTAHFNKVSYWCQTRILEQENENVRKEIMRKILKIMKCLRRLNNFNSYIAIFSALESASVSRLEWSEQVAKDMEEPRLLMDPSKSYQNFRKAYAEVYAPCLSYLGLYLNDLTFINVGTKSYLDEEKVNLNFSKQWTLYQTLKQLDKCRHKDYEFKTDKAVVEFFNDFNDHFSDDALYKLSLQIRPRAS